MENIYLFKGNEELIIHNKIETIIKNAKVPSFNKTTYDLEISSLNDAINDCLTIPFMSNKKIVIIKNPHFLEKGGVDSKTNIKLFQSYLKKPNLDCVLIIDATRIAIDEKSEIYRELEKAAEVSDTKELSDVEMQGWLRRQFQVNGIQIDADAIELFFDYVGTNLVRGKTEIDKLVNYLGERKTLNVDDIKKIVTDNGETDIFALTKAINIRDKALVNKIYNELIRNGFDQIQLMNMIYKSFRDIYTVLCLLNSGVNKNDIASAMGVTPGRAYYLMKDANNFGLETVKKTLYNLSELDYKIKTGQIDKATGMDLFLFGM